MYLMLIDRYIQYSAIGIAFDFITSSGWGSSLTAGEKLEYENLNVTIRAIN